MLLNPNHILPSQDFLKPKTIKFILGCITAGNTDALPPSPIVRQNNAGRYIAIDGHNLIAVKAFRNEDIKVHIANHPQDGLPETSSENRQRNADLLAKYEAVLKLQQETEAAGICSFQDLIAHNSEVFTR